MTFMRDLALTMYVEMSLKAMSLSGAQWVRRSFVLR